METERERILKGFEEMRDILDKEEKRELQKLDDNEVHVLDNLAMAKDQVVQQRQYTRELISDLQHHMRESSIDRLQVGLGMEILCMRFGGIIEIRFPSPLGSCTFFFIKGSFDPSVLLFCHSFHGSLEKFNVQMTKETHIIVL